MQLTPSFPASLGNAVSLEKPSPSASLCWPKVSRPGKAEPAGSLSKPTQAWHVGSGRAREGGLGVLIPEVQLSLGDPWPVTTALTSVALGSATPLLNLNDLQLLAYSLQQQLARGRNI